MKRLIRKVAVTIALTVVAIVAVLGILKHNEESRYDAIIEDALAEIQEKWEDVYDDDFMKDHIKIVNTQIIMLNDNPDFDDEHKVFERPWEEHFDGVKMIVQFEILSDYFGYNCDYYENQGIYDEVLVYEDGECEIAEISLRYVSSRAFMYDYSEIIDEFVDLGDRYNRTIEID